MSEEKALAVVPTQATPELEAVTEHDVMAKAGKLPKGVEQRVVGEVRRMAAHAALAEGAAKAITTAQAHVQEVLLRDRQASRARYAEIESLLTDEEKLAWRELEHDTFASGINVARHAMNRIVEAEAAARLPDDGFAYEDWTFKDNVKDVFTFGEHRLRRQGIQRIRFRQPPAPVYQQVIIKPAPVPRTTQP